MDAVRVSGNLVNEPELAGLLVAPPNAQLNEFAEHSRQEPGIPHLFLFAGGRGWRGRKYVDGMLIGSWSDEHYDVVVRRLCATVAPCTPIHAVRWIS